MIYAVEAEKILGIKRANMINTPTMRKYYYPPDGTKPALFDLEGYLRELADKGRLYHGTTLFIEWLKWEKKITYAEMSRRTGISLEAIRTHRIGFKACYRICKAFEEYIKEYEQC